MNFNGKKVLVTGASRGIGKSIAKLFVKYGAKVAATATNKKNVEIINQYLQNNGKGYLLNVTNHQSIEDILYKIHQEFGNIDILINNIGIISDNLIIRMKKEDWNKVIDINLNSIFTISKNIIHSMIKKRYGRIISIGSVIGMTGNIGQTNYSASKAGIIGFSKSLAIEVASRGITVNVVSPGFIETDMSISLLKNKKEKILEKIPMKRLGKTKDVANSVIFLASDQASYITGINLHVNGGMYMI
ncbi:MAG: 3-oxoacyl-[acyl-carrier-protein] reductase [Arsenophonus sp.]|nr:MAG: 3-oxoacyl-[acyl-carrier-protein] reductase [Arsenophonus sp.]